MNITYFSVSIDFEKSENDSLPQEPERHNISDDLTGMEPPFKKKKTLAKTAEGRANQAWKPNAYSKPKKLSKRKASDSEPAEVPPVSKGKDKKVLLTFNFS